MVEFTDPDLTAPTPQSGPERKPLFAEKVPIGMRFADIAAGDRWPPSAEPDQRRREENNNLRFRLVSDELYAIWQALLRAGIIDEAGLPTKEGTGTSGEGNTYIGGNSWQSGIPPWMREWLMNYLNQMGSWIQFLRRAVWVIIKENKTGNPLSYSRHATGEMYMAHEFFHKGRFGGKYVLGSEGIVGFTVPGSNTPDDLPENAWVNRVFADLQNADGKKVHIVTEPGTWSDFFTVNPVGWSYDEAEYVFKIIDPDGHTPRVRIGYDPDHYDLPLADGNENQAMLTDGAGDVSWENVILPADWPTNGFPEAADAGLAWTDGTRTLELSPTGSSFDYYIQGIKYTATGAISHQITDTEGMWVFYLDAEGSMTAEHEPSHSRVDIVIENTCIVAWLYWDATNNDGRLMDERHGSVMSPATHHWAHDCIKSVYISGMALSNISADDVLVTAASAQFGTEAGEFYDEDLSHDLAAIASTTGLEIWYLDGANWRWTTNAGFSVLTAGTGRIAFNDAGSQTEAGNNNFVLCHIFATNIVADDGTDPKFIAIQGQAEYANKNDARDGAETEITALAYGTLPLEEIIRVGTVIFQTSNGYVNAVKGRVVSTNTGDDYVDWRTSNPAAGGSVVNDHGMLSGLSDDDHTDYLTEARANTWFLTKDLADLAARDHDDLQNVSSDQHHNEAHTIVSHSDVTTATGPNLDELVGGGVTALHSHAGGSGDVVGPGSATDEAIARFDGATGKLIQNSPTTIDDTGVIYMASSLAMQGQNIIGAGGTWHLGGGLFNLFGGTITDSSANKVEFSVDIDLAGNAIIDSSTDDVVIIDDDCRINGNLLIYGGGMTPIVQVLGTGAGDIIDVEVPLDMQGAGTAPLVLHSSFNDTFLYVDSSGSVEPALEASAATQIAINTGTGGLMEIGPPQFSDAGATGFQVFDAVDNTKVFRLDCGNITTATTRRFEVPDRNLAEEEFYYIGATAPTAAEGQLWFNTGDQTLYAYDGDRSKWLSVETFQISFAKNATISGNTYLNWIDGMTTNARGALMPKDCTIVKAAVSTQSAPSASNSFLLNADASTVLTLTLTSGNTEVYEEDSDADVDAGEQLRAGITHAGGNYEDPRYTVWLKWRTT